MGAREDFVACVRAQVGRPYQWGTHGPDTFDCSGLVCYCYQQATGKQITCSSYETPKLGKLILARPDWRDGDIVMWDTENNMTIGHVGVVAGHQIINALNEARGVIASSPDADFGGPYRGAIRLDWGEGEKPDPKPPKEPKKPKRPRKPRERRHKKEPI
jgi:cell wall-associated NlpC family hydrolase